MPSSVIDSFHYDWEDAVLYVRFVSGELYRYDDVPARVPAAWLGAASKGQFFGTHVRPAYEGERLGRDAQPPPAAERLWPTRPYDPVSPRPVA